MLGAIPPGAHIFVVMFPGIGSLDQECCTSYSNAPVNSNRLPNLRDMIKSVSVCVCVCVAESKRLSNAVGGFTNKKT